MFLSETCIKCLGSFCNIRFFWLVMPVKSGGIVINPLVGCDCNAEFRPPGVSRLYFISLLMLFYEKG